MKSFKYLILLSMLLISIICKDSTEAKEFDENTITSDLQTFSFKTKNTSLIILIAKNENYDPNTYDTKNIIVFNSLTKEVTEFKLYGITYCIIDNKPHDEDIEYTLKFRNYMSGNFIIYNSNNIYPIKDLEKGFNFCQEKAKKDTENFNLTFITETLEENALLNIYPGEKMKIKKISDIEDEYLEIKENFIELSKGSKYKIEYNDKSNLIDINIKKREVINYKKNDEFRFNLYNKIPYFILFKTTDFDTDLIYSYLYSIDSIHSTIELAEFESEDIDISKDIEFTNKETIFYSKVYEIQITNSTKNYILLRLTKTMYERNYDYFRTFKIFEEFTKYYYYSTGLKETLVIERNSNRMIFAFSNISNIRTFEDKESKSIIYQKESTYFPFIVLPTKESFDLNVVDIYYDIYGEIYKKEISFNYHLYTSFNYINKKKLWYFDINESSTLYIKSLFGTPKIYYFDEINEDSIDNIKYNNYEKLKKLNASNDVLNFNSPLAIYIEPYENSYLNFFISNNENLNIIKEFSNKYLIENKKYILSTPCKLMIRLDDNNFNSNINIYKDDIIISTLNAKNQYINIDESSEGNLF